MQFIGGFLFMTVVMFLILKKLTKLPTVLCLFLGALWWIVLPATVFVMFWGIVYAICYGILCLIFDED